MTLPAPLRVACVGGSITFGLGLADRRRECYPAVLGELLDSQGESRGLGPGPIVVKNFGYSGATASRGGNEPYWRTPSFTAATRFRPHVTLLMLGTNDAQFANAESRQTFAADLAALIDHFRKVVEDETTGAPVGNVLIAQPPPVFPPVPEIDFGALEEIIRPTIRQVAVEKKVPLLDMFAPFAEANSDFPDGLHPSAPATRRIAQIAFETLVGWPSKN